MCDREGCFNAGTEKHHIVKRSQCKAMINAPCNLVNLCYECHRGTNGVHGKNGHKLDIELKKQLQRKLEWLFNRELYSMKDVQELLGINAKDTKMLLRCLDTEKRKYRNTDIIRACLGGRLYE